MRTLQEKYNGVLEGKFSKTQFRRDAATELPQFVSNVNSFDDTVAILKNKGVVTEAKKEEKYFEARDVDNIAPDVLDTGIKFELDKKFDTLDVSKEDYEKAKETAVKNLTKDRAYYSKEVGEQLPTPGEKMEKAKLNEGFLDRFKKKPAQSSTAPAKVLSADDIQARIEKEAKTNTIGDILDAAVVQQTIDLRNATPEQIKTFVSVARKADHGGDTVTGDNSMSYLKKLPNYGSIEEAGMLEGMSKEEAEAWKEFQAKHNVTDKTIKVAKADFEKEWAKRTDEAIQNIENDEQTKIRIDGLINQLRKDVDPRDEDHAVRAYVISVENDLESGDASRLKRYKDLLSIDDLKDDMRHYISHDVDQLEETLTNDEVFDLLDDMDEIEDYAAGTGDLEKKLAGIAALQKKYEAHKEDPKLQNFFSDLALAAKQTDKGEANKYISSAAGEIEKLDPRLKKEVNEDETLDKVQVLITPPGSKPFLALDGKEMSHEEADKFIERSKNVRGETKAEKIKSGHKNYGPKGALLGKPIKEEREALKEMFKKIIAKVIND